MNDGPAPPPAGHSHRTVPLQRAILLLIATALLAGIIPAGIALDRLLGRELEARAAADLAMAPDILADRNVAISDAMMMHAKDVADAPGLADAVVRGDRAAALVALTGARAQFSDEPLLVGAGHDLWAGGPAPDSALLSATRRGEMPVTVVPHEDGFRMLALAPVKQGADWVGAAGVTRALDETTAATLAGLTRSDVVILNARGGLAAASPPDSVATALAGRDSSALRGLGGARGPHWRSAVPGRRQRPRRRGSRCVRAQPARRARGAPGV